MEKSHAIFSSKEIMSPMTKTRSKIVLRPSIDFTNTKKALQSQWGKLGGIKSRPIGAKDSIHSTEISSRTTGVYHQNNGWSTSKNTKSSVWRTQLSALNDEIVQNSQISVISRHFPVISVIIMNKLKFFSWHTL